MPTYNRGDETVITVEGSPCDRELADDEAWELDDSEPEQVKDSPKPSKPKPATTSGDQA